MGLEAVIFDLDGVIADTEKLHAEAKREVLENVLEEDFNLSLDEVRRRYAGRSTIEVFHELFQKENLDQDPGEAYEEKRQKYQERLKENGIQPMDGVVELLEDLDGDYKLAVASGSRPENINTVLDKLDLKDYFEETVSARRDEIESGKPDPEVFQYTARQIDVEPGNCVVLEDSSNGMEAARRAGMVCVGLVKGEGDYPAHATVESLKQLDRNALEEIYSEVNGS